MTDPASPHMSADDFRRHGRAVIDWIADYLEQVERYPVMSPVKPGEVRDRLPRHAPESGEPFEQVLRDVQEIILPGVTHWQSPGFFGYFPANNSYPSILGELLSAGLGVQGMLWATSPSCTELETLVLDWLVDMLGLPAGFRSVSALPCPTGRGIGSEGADGCVGLHTTVGGGVIQDTASSAVLCAMLAARERATGGASNRDGLAGVGAPGVVRQTLVAYTSAQAHSSVEKAAMIAGIGSRNLRLIETDHRFAMRVDLLRQAIERDLEAGLTPFFVCATVGTTSSLAVDPVEAIGEMLDDVFEREASRDDVCHGRVGRAGAENTCGGGSGAVAGKPGDDGSSARSDAAGETHGSQSRGTPLGSRGTPLGSRGTPAGNRGTPVGSRSTRPWLHVDAALAGTAALCPEFRWINRGVERADSYCFNPHKWMLTNFDCSCLWVRDRAALIRALSILPEYLRNQATESGAVIDYRDWQIPLGRRFRALKLWFVIRHYGVEGLRTHVRRCVEMARWLARRVEEHPDLELAATPTLSLVCFRHRGGEATTQRILDGVNRSGQSFITHTRLNGHLTLRVAVGAWRTRMADVETLWGWIVDNSR